MFVSHSNFEPVETMLRRRFNALRPQIRKQVESSVSTQGSVISNESVERAVQEAYNLFVDLAKHGSLELAYPTPLAMAALKLQQRQRRSCD